MLPVQDIVCQLHRFITAMAKYHTDCHESMKSIVNIFPIEVDLPESMSNSNAYKNSLKAFEELSKSLEESRSRRRWRESHRHFDQL